MIKSYSFWMTKLPNPYELSSWHQDIKKLPPIKLWDVSFYLLTKPSDFTKESAQNLKSMEAYYFFTAGHVQDIYMHKISEQSEFCFIKTEVKLGVFLYIFVMSMIFAFQYWVTMTVTLVTYYKEMRTVTFLHQVLPSQRQGSKAILYQVWVCLHREGWVKDGNCSCMAGLASTCSHVAALLFKLSKAVELNLNTPDASTDMLCRWNASRKQVYQKKKWHW